MPGLSSSFFLSEDSTSCTIDTARTRHIAHYRKKTGMYAKQINKDGKQGPRRVDSKNLYN